MRAVSNFRTGFPNQLGHISDHAATVAEVLRDEGYATFCAGKWHLAPMEQCSAAGPFDQWPLGRGFDRFYGFLEGETDQFHPELVCDNHPIDSAGRSRRRLPPVARTWSTRPCGMIADSKGVRPDRPFFTYLAFGATHAPHQAPAEYLAKYRGAFDEGWDVVRQRWYERQLELGVIPEGTAARAAQPGRRAVGRPAREPAAPGRPAAGGVRRVPRPHRRPDRSARRRPARLGQLDNTILVVLADNGASQEGGPFGVHARDEVLQRHPRDCPTRRSSASTTSAARTATPTTRGAGRSAATPRSSGTSRTPTRAASTCR